MAAKLVSRTKYKLRPRSHSKSNTTPPTRKKLWTGSTKMAVCMSAFGGGGIWGDNENKRSRKTTDHSCICPRFVYALKGQQMSIDANIFFAS